MVFDVRGKASGSDATIASTARRDGQRRSPPRAIHRGSPRRDKALPRRRRGAMPPQILESELFGQESGAFTGLVS